MLVGAEGMPPISYGLQRRHALRITGDRREPLGAFSVSGAHFTFLNAMTAPPWIGGTSDDPSLLQLAQIPFMDLRGEQDIRAVLGEARRVLRPGGRLCLASLSIGIGPFSRFVERSWRAIHARHA